MHLTHKNFIQLEQPSQKHSQLLGRNPSATKRYIIEFPKYNNHIFKENKVKV